MVASSNLTASQSEYWYTCIFMGTDWELTCNRYVYSPDGGCHL